MSPTAPTVRLEGAELRFGGKEVFRGLSLTLQASQWTCLLGPSGVGKSSLLRQMAGLSQDGGSMKGTITSDDGQPLDGRVAYMAQQDLLLPWATVLQNALIGPTLRRGYTIPDEVARAQTILEQVGLADEADALPATLSGGMRQRAALARTLFEDRPIVLMDEPFSALDALTRRRLQNLAISLLQDRTVLLVTHDPIEALRVGGTIFTLTGNPARMSDSLTPAGVAPRDETEDQLWPLHAELLRRLEANGAEAA